MAKLANKLNSIEEVYKIVNNQDVITDLITSFCGEKLGEGVYRDCYEFNLNPKYIVKIERTNSDCNMQEYLLWDEIQGLKGSLAWVKNWFAPIHWCSPNGKILIMEKTKKLNINRPTKVPEFFTDVHSNNFGWLGKNFVCHDYGHIYKFIKYEKKFQNIKW